MTSEQNKLSDARWDGVSVERLPIEVAAAEALAHVADGDSFGSSAKNPTTIRTRQLLEKLANHALSRRASAGGELHGPFGWLNGCRGLSEDSWTIDSDPMENNDEYFAIPLYAKTDPFKEAGSAPAPLLAPVAWANVRADGVIVGLSEVKPDNWLNEPRPLVFAPALHFKALPDVENGQNTAQETQGNDCIPQADNKKAKVALPDNQEAIAAAARQVRSVCNRFDGAKAIYPDIEEWFESSAYSIVAAYMRSSAKALPDVSEAHEDYVKRLLTGGPTNAQIGCAQAAAAHAGIAVPFHAMRAALTAALNAAQGGK